MIKKDEITFSNLWCIPLFRDIFWLTMTFLTFWLVYSMWQIFFPIAISLLLAYLCHPLVIHLERKWHISRSISTTLLIFLVLILIIGVFIWLIPLLAMQLQMLFSNLPAYLEIISKKTGVDLQEFIPKDLSKFELEKVWTSEDLLQSTGRILSLLKNIFSTATYVLFTTLVIPVFWFLFVIHFDRMLAFVAQFISASQRSEIFTIVKKMDQAISDFFRGRLLIAVILSAMFSFGWWITQIPYWFLLGTLTGILNIIPYASLVGWPIAILLKYIDYLQQSQSNDNFMSIVLWPSIVYGIVQFIDGWLLTPWIQGEKTDLSVATVLLAAFIGGYLGGFLGLLLAIPAAACLKIILWESVLPRLKNWAETH